MKYTEKQIEMLDGLVKKLMEGDNLPGFIEKTLFIKEGIVKLPMDAPIINWSATNTLITLLSGTNDARGYRQWQRVGRHVKEGCKAIHILAPIIKKVKTKEIDPETGEIQTANLLIGFKSIPVFRYEDTEVVKGFEDPYVQETYEGHEPDLDVNSLPLIEVAKDLGIEVVADYTQSGEYGSCTLTADRIRMCTDYPQTFLHELSHAVDIKLGNFKQGGRDLAEIVAELSACFLMYTMGMEANMKYTHEYIESWSKGHPFQLISKAVGRVIEIYNFLNSKSDIEEGVA